MAAADWCSNSSASLQDSIQGYLNIICSVTTHATGADPVRYIYKTKHPMLCAGIV